MFSGSAACSFRPFFLYRGYLLVGLRYTLFYPAPFNVAVMFFFAQHQELCSPLCIVRRSLSFHSFLVELTFSPDYIYGVLLARFGFLSRDEFYVLRFDIISDRPRH